MNTLEAIELRHSRRSYMNTPIDSSKISLLKSIISQYNKESGLSIQFIENAGQVFRGFFISYGMFHGVSSIIALVGKQADTDLKEKAGYYGELTILEATKLGLGTCFVSGSYDKKSCPCRINPDESLICVITIGNVENDLQGKEKFIYQLSHRRTKKPEELYESDTAEIPEWFLKGIKAVQKAPSAMNRHPVLFSFKNGKVNVWVNNTQTTGLIDLGIAKANFEAAAGGRFQLGNYGILVKN